MTLGDIGRGRHSRTRRRIARVREEFINPYPWMSAPEAKVHLFLEAAGVPFSWRFFDGQDTAPHLNFLLPDFHPEFTLREYKAVILIIGGFFGTLPGVIDRVSLGQVLLEQDGWKVAVLFENDIRSNLEETIYKELPELKHPTIRGRPRPSRYGISNEMEQRRQQLRAQALRRKQKFIDEDVQLKVKSRDRFKSRHLRPTSQRRIRRLGT